MFAAEIELKDKNLERKINNQDNSPLKTIADHEEFISINEIDNMINNLDVKKAQASITN